MSTHAMTAKDEREAKILIAAYKIQGYQNFAVFGRDTSLDAFGQSKPGEYVVVASTKGMAVVKSNGRAASKDAEKVLAEGMEEATGTKS